MNKSFLRKIAVVSAAAMAFMTTLCGCGDNPSESESILPELVIGSDYYSPFIFHNDKGEFAGIDVELATEVCRQLGYKASFKHINWADKNTLLENGEVDCLWGCFSLTGREEDYSWTLPYMNSRQVVAVFEKSGINKIADLEGKSVAVQATSKPDEIFSGGGEGNSGIPKLKALNCFPSMAYTFAAINGGYVDAVAGHEEAIIEYMKTSSISLRILDEPLLEVKLGVAFLKGTNANIIEKINKTFLILRKNGYISKLYSSYGLDPETHMVNYEQI